MINSVIDISQSLTISHTVDSMHTIKSKELPSINQIDFTELMERIYKINNPNNVTGRVLIRQEIAYYIIMKCPTMSFGAIFNKKYHTLVSDVFNVVIALISDVTH